jgi:hypothetical protein
MRMLKTDTVVNTTTITKIVEYITKQMSSSRKPKPRLMPWL